MKSKVLITHSYFLQYDPKQFQTGQPYPPLGTLYAAAILRDRGYDVVFFDNMFEPNINACLNKLKQEQPDYFVIYDDGFNYLTKMCLTNMREAAFQLCKHAQAQQCVTIVSSSDATDRYANYLNEGADYVLIGEADDTLPELVDSLSDISGINFQEIAGISYLDNGIAIKTSTRKVITDLDRLPFPAWDILDITPYRSLWLKNKGYLSLNITTTRGCPFKCNWCAKPIYGNRYNSRSPQNVVEELLLIKRLFSFEHIWFCDDIFGLKPKWVQEFARLLKQHSLTFRFKIQSRADLLLDQEDVAALAQAGCENAWIGAESGSQAILNAMDKGITVHQIETATALLKKHHVHPSFFIQFGYPGETLHDIEQTIGMINRLLPHEIGISVSYPLPGTVFYERVAAQLKDKSNWTDSNEMALLFRNTYPKAFYKQLHRYVHQNYHRHLARAELKRIFSLSIALNAATIKKALSIVYYEPVTWLEKLRLNKAEKSVV